MALNKLMHPRNIYKNPPDFSELAVLYPDFLQISKMDLNGKISIDFKDTDSLRTLTRCLLLKDFKLDVFLPPEKLVPTLPLRLNYILWLEDICDTLYFKNVIGVDIGCGASCIYPLIAANKKNWKMYALEADSDSLHNAFENVKKNKLTDMITIINQKNTESIFGALFDEIADTRIDFCMCNPPFYNSLDNIADMYQNRTGNRKPPKNAKTGIKTELSFDGGEVEFVKKIIKESCELKDRINVYTTMIGIKSNVNILIKELRGRNITNYVETEFCQGHTTRWGLAWTFRNDLLLRKVICINNPNKSFNFLVPNNIKLQLTIVNVADRLKKVLDNLGIKIVQMTETDSLITWEIKALQNTWSHQRRKRREATIPKTQSEIVTTESKPDIDLLELIPTKKIKLDVEEEHIADETSPILIAEISIKTENGIQLEMLYLDGVAGRDGVHQILQYIINKWNE